jgi:hypothetical protein
MGILRSGFNAFDRAVTGGVRKLSEAPLRLYENGSRWSSDRAAVRDAARVAREMVRGADTRTGASRFDR